MGADGWTEVGPWHDDPGESLRALQRQRLDQRYPLARFVRDRLAGARGAMEATRSGRSPPSLKAHLLEVYGADVAFLERVQSGPLPVDLAGELEIVRRVCGADGCGGVLDVTSAGDALDPMTARVLSPDELYAIFGTAKATHADVRRAGAGLPDVGRGECICFPLFDDSGSPVGWWFQGCEVD